MATLTEAAIFSKKSFHVLLIGLGVLLVLLIFIRIAGNLKDELFPPSPLPATVAFDKLPKVDLSEGAKPSADLIYKMETISGDLPVLPTSAKVFKIEMPEVTFGDLERTKSKVAQVGFFGEPVEIIQGKAKFVDSKSQSRQITINLASGNFTFNNNFLNDPRLSSIQLRSQAEGIAKAYGFFYIFGLDETEFPRNRATITRYSLSDTNLKEADSISSTNLIRVNLNRGDIDKMPVINASLDNNRVWALVSSIETLEAKLSITPIKLHKFATYPLKGVDKAYQELKNGKAFFNKEPEGKIFSIREVVLGYVDTEKFQPYLQPFYLFKGENGQIVYIGAVDETWIKQVN